MSSALSAKLDRLEASMPEEEMEVIVTLVTDAEMAEVRKYAVAQGDSWAITITRDGEV